MVTIIRYTVLVLASFVFIDARPQTVSAASDTLGLEAGEYPVGFRLLEGQDGSRAVTGGVAGTTYPRPIRAYVWYPAQGDAGVTPMRFGRYFSLADEDIRSASIGGILQERLKFSRRPLARSLNSAGIEALSERPVLAVEDAAPREGQFPLIVIGLGLYYETPVAFAAMAEYLAGHGFVVAISPLIGTDSPFVRIDAQDLETQIRDLEFVIGQVRRLPFVSRERLGLFGFDMGGMAALVLTMRNPDVDALLTADAGVLYPHPSGVPGELPDHDPSALDVPWLHATRSAAAAPPPGLSEGESLFARAVHSDRYLLLSDTIKHVDFTSYALIENRSAMTGYWEQGTPEAAARHRAFAEYVYNFFAAYVGESAEGLAMLLRDPPVSPASMILEHREAIPAPTSYGDFVHQVIAGRATEAIDELRALAELEPDHVLLEEEYLFRLSYSLLFTWGLAEEGLPVIEFLVERFPSSGNGLQLLGEAHIALHDYAAATDSYSKLLKQYPNNAAARSRLEWLREQ